MWMSKLKVNNLISKLNEDETKAYKAAKKKMEAAEEAVKKACSSERKRIKDLETFTERYLYEFLSGMYKSIFVFGKGRDDIFIGRKTSSLQISVVTKSGYTIRREFMPEDLDHLHRVAEKIKRAILAVEGIES